MDDLVLDIVEGRRPPTGHDLEAIRWQVAQAGFGTTASRAADDRLIGQRRLDGSAIHPGDFLPTSELHYLRHVVVQEEWPSWTTPTVYEWCLRSLALDPRAGILLRQIAHFGWHITMVGRSGRWKGRLGSDWMVVEYRVAEGHWVTGYQPRDGLLFANRRLRRRWLRLPT
jgi:hypothetical protein